jgi:hypothetical protein
MAHPHLSAGPRTPPALRDQGHRDSRHGSWSFAFRGDSELLDPIGDRLAVVRSARLRDELAGSLGELCRSPGSVLSCRRPRAVICSAMNASIRESKAPTWPVAEDAAPWLMPEPGTSRLGREPLNHASTAPPAMTAPTAPTDIPSAAACLRPAITRSSPTAEAMTLAASTRPGRVARVPGLRREELAYLAGSAPASTRGWSRGGPRRGSAHERLPKHRTHLAPAAADVVRLDRSLDGGGSTMSCGCPTTGNVRVVD